MRTLFISIIRHIGLGLWLFCVSNVLLAQKHFEEHREIAIDPSQSNIIAIPQSSTIYGNYRKVNSLRFSVRFSIYEQGEEYNLGTGGDSFFDHILTFRLRALDANNNEINGIFKDGVIEISIDNDSPEIFYTKALDLKRCVNSNDPYHENLIPDKIEIFEMNLVSDPGSKVNAVFITGHSFVEYAYGVQLNSRRKVAPATPYSPVIYGKTATFEWEHLYPFTCYQLQVIKLYNTNEANLSDDNVAIKRITADIDWDKAMTFQINVDKIFDNNGNINSTRSIQYTLGEGTGYYAWRVRPIGTFFSNGIANSQNWGTWSNQEEGEITLDQNNIAGSYFYMQDMDEDKNWIYSRVLDEEGKTKETTTYANSLNQVRQTQTYLSSEDITLTTHTVLDYAGRPSLTSLPAPIESKSDSYIENFLRSGGNLYTSENYAGDDKMGEADPLDETGDMDYYNNNQNVRIPDAQGYGFVSQTYHKDPLGRVKEESGPGETHRIKSDGQGRTRKYYYSIPNKEEIVNLFGSETPNKESVTKMVSIDENNISTITYLDMNGKTLATCLMINEDDEGLLVPLDGQFSFDRANQEILKENELTSWGFLSKKQFVLMQETMVKISYQVKKQQLDANCIMVDLNCKYLLDVTIKNLQTGETIVVAEDVVVNENNPDIQLQEINGDSYLVLNDLAELDLMPGSYFVEKRLKPGTGSINEEAARQRLQNQIMPIVNNIKDWYDRIRCQPMVPDFHQSIYNFRDAINAGELNTFDNGSLKDKYPVELTSFYNTYNEILNEGEPEERLVKDLYYMELFRLGDDRILYPIGENEYGIEPYLAILQTPCCEIKIPTKWIKQFNFEVEPDLRAGSDGKLQVHNVLDDVEPEFIPDFEGYAMAFLEECEDLRYINDNHPGFYIFMDGWFNDPLWGQKVPKGTFNLMVYHMVNDEMPCSNPFIEREKNIDGDDVFTNNKKPEYDECGNLINNDGGNGMYTVVQLFKCWKGVLEHLKREVACTGYGIDYENESIEENMEEEDPGLFYDQFFEAMEDLSMSQKIRVFLQLREMDTGTDTSGNVNTAFIPPSFHLVKNFLECTGYAFVKILSPFDPEPLDSDIAPGFAYKEQVSINDPVVYDNNYLYKLSEGITMNDYFANYRRDGSGGHKVGDYPYIPLKNWDPKVRDDEWNKTDKSMFPRIKNPIYAYKYFVYPEEGSVNMKDVEYQVCYNDPNDCYVLENGYVKEVNGRPYKIPCCLSNYDPTMTEVDLFMEDFCYADAEYPYLEDHILKSQDNELRFKEVDGKNTRLIVRNFTDIGRVRCPYTHEDWSCGQRYTFYMGLTKNYKIDETEWSEPVTRTSFDYTNPTKLWLNEDETGAFISGDHNQIVIDREKNAIEAAEQVTLTQYESAERWDEDVDPEDDITLVEMEMTKARNQCLESMKYRKGEIYNKVVKMFRDRCYVVGECKDVGPEYEHIVPTEDVWIIVGKILEEMTKQCNALNTFMCEDAESRDLMTSNLELHANNTYVKLLIGMGGFSSPDIACDGTVPAKTFYDQYCTEGIDCNGDGVKDLFNCSPKIVYEKHGIKTDEEDYSWYQYTQMKQAMEWDFELDLPSMCEENKYQRELDISNCGNNTEGNTYVDKRAYELRESEVFDENNIRVGNPVESPVKQIVVEIKPEN